MLLFKKRLAHMESFFRQIKRIKKNQQIFLSINIFINMMCGHCFDVNLADFEQMINNFIQLGVE